ncbi:MAG: GFA family protein [Stenotrophomonas sp.]
MLSGSCHCGAVQFTAEGEASQAYECNCSHCSRKGLLITFVPEQALTITAGEDQLRTYTFNTHVIQHRFCGVCGCQPFGLGRSPDGKAMAAINLRCVPDIDLATLKRVPVNGRAF